MFILRLSPSRRLPVGKSRAFAHPSELLAELERQQRALDEDEQTECRIELGNGRLRLRLERQTISVFNNRDAVWMPLDTPGDLLRHLGNAALAG